MDIKNLLKFKKTGSDAKKTGKKMIHCWICHQQAVFIIFVLVSAAAGSYVWYKSLYQSEWSAEEKNNYLISQNREVNLKEEEFRKVIGEIENRKNLFDSEFQPVKDIFKPY